jgi:serine/threonine-protein kinase RsbW
MMPNFRAGFTGERKNVPLARNAIATFARICGFSREEVDDIRLAAGEAISNAVEHGRGARSSGFSVRCTFVDDQLTIEIRDNGDGFALADGGLIPAEGAQPAPGRMRGYGIFLMRRLMDGVTFDNNGSCVRLWRRHIAS